MSGQHDFAVSGLSGVESCPSVSSSQWLSLKNLLRSRAPVDQRHLQGSEQGIGHTGSAWQVREVSKLKRSDSLPPLAATIYSSLQFKLKYHPRPDPVVMGGLCHKPAAEVSGVLHTPCLDASKGRHIN